MLNQLTPSIQSLILDMDGVLWRDDTLLLDLPAAFQRIQDLGLKVALATNNATRSVEMYLDRFSRYGVTLQSWQVINSAIALGCLLKTRFPHGGPVFVVGEQGVCDTLAEYGFYPDSHDPLAVVVGMDRAITYEKITQATLLIRSGIPFYATNPDKTFPTPHGLAPGAGAIIAAVQAASDVQPVIAGKPEAVMMQVAMQRLNTPAHLTLAVGDRLETDILGGANAGCRTALVLSGVATRADLARFSPSPDLVADDLAQLLGMNDPAGQSS